MTDTLLDELARGTGDLLRGALGGHEIRQVWTDHDRILFRLANGRTGDVEIVLNWDAGDAILRAKPEEAHCPHGTSGKSTAAAVAMNPSQTAMISPALIPAVENKP